METNICKEKSPSGCGQIVPVEPCRYFVIRNGVKVYIEVNPDDYRIVGQNKDCYFLTLK